MQSALVNDRSLVEDVTASSSLPRKRHREHSSDWPSLGNAELLQRCRNLISSQAPRRMVAFYANPMIPSRANMPYLPLGRDMRALISQLNPFDFFLMPATTLDFFTTTLQTYWPSVVVLSGHGVTNNLILETPDGRGGHMVTSAVLVDALKAVYDRVDARQSPELFVFLACNTSEVVGAVSAAFPTAGVIGFTTLVEDEAARAFSTALFVYLADRFTENTKIDAKKTFDVAMKKFKQNFLVGDPITMARGQPRVHGIPVLYIAGKEVLADDYSTGGGSLPLLRGLTLRNATI